MTRQLLIASAGSGKTYRIVDEAITMAKSGKRILFVTYTENNQLEIKSKLIEMGRGYNELFNVKGLFTFLLEDVIRPYQSCIFDKRIEGVHFNGTNPHKRNGRTIPGRKEKNSGGEYSAQYFLTESEKLVHTTYIAKLAARIIKESKLAPIRRLEAIYDHIYIDEIQDFIGWDYEVIKAISKSKKIGITCVGDFRQTIYDTAIAQKQPLTPEQKTTCFEQMKFQKQSMNISRRSIQSICNFSDTIHNELKIDRTESLVNELPRTFTKHNGVFIVKRSDVFKYIDKYSPTLLKTNATAGKEFNNIRIDKMTFGKSKGLSFSRVLIEPTKKQLQFLRGNKKVFDSDKTSIAKNKFYVAATRARYSLAFVVPDKMVKDCELEVWGL